MISPPLYCVYKYLLNLSIQFDSLCNCPYKNPKVTISVKIIHHKLFSTCKETLTRPSHITEKYLRTESNDLLKTCLSPLVPFYFSYNAVDYRIKDIAHDLNIIIHSANNDMNKITAESQMWRIQGKRRGRNFSFWGLLDYNRN